MPRTGRDEAAHETQAAHDPRAPSPAGELAAPGREQVAAALRANRAIAEGLEAMGREMIDYTQTSLEAAAVAAKDLLRVRTFADLVRVNADFFKASLEDLAMRSARLSEVGAKLAQATLAAAEASGESDSPGTKSQAA